MTTLDLPNNGSHLAPTGAHLTGAGDERITRARRARLAGRVTLAVPVLGAAAGAWLLSRGRRTRGVGLGALGAALGLGLVRWQLQRFVTERVDYEVEATLGDVELRSYPEQVWAETVVHASWNDALSEGFKRLAGYIFGDNDATERLSMTAPVLSSLPSGASTGEKLSMTAPVLATVGDDGADTTSRTVSFVMPGDRTLADLPKPRDPRVQLRVVPARLVAALVFRGNYKSGLPAAKREELLEKLHAAGMESKGEATFAGYDPPSTIPALRRNEVLVELADP